MTLAEPVQITQHIARIFEQLQMKYFVGGSLASSRHGELRATNDIDLMIDLPTDRVDDFVAALKPHFDIWKDTVQSAVEAGRSFGALHIEWHVKVDFFPMGSSTLDVRSMARRQAVQMGDASAREIYFASAEDIVLRKLEWYRKSHDVLERQLRDIAGVMKVRGRSLDFAYLRSMAAELGLSTLLERCLSEAGLG
jgi:hypothetical protein